MRGRASMLMLALLLLAFYGSSTHCPCSAQTRLKTLQESNQTMCILRNDRYKSALDSLESQLKSSAHFLGSIEEATKPVCSSVVEIVDQQSLPSRYLCPGSCHFPRKVVIPASVLDWKPLLQDSAALPSISLSCSLTLQSVVDKFRSVRGASWPSFLVQSIHHRRLQECSESHALAALNEQPLQDSALSYPRRDVDGLVVWIGSYAMYQRMENQHTSLTGLPFHSDGPGVVLGWAASDRLYPCPGNSSRCIGSNRKYSGLLPKSDMNFMPPGWGCAQRRPLRALSHVLALFSPHYLVLLDDDTFFNYPLFSRLLGPLLSTTFQQESVFLGEMMGKTGEAGHVSTRGFAIGGAGYVLGRRLLSQLAAHEVAAYGYEDQLLSRHHVPLSAVVERIAADAYRSKQQVWHLSVLGEGIQYAQQYCTDPLPDPRGSHGDAMARHGHGSSAQAGVSVPSASCIRMDGRGLSEEKSEAISVPISTRLVDFCTNLMANEHTCQHSDHSLGRCLVYGARSRPLSAYCHGRPRFESPSTANSSSPILGMCFMTPKCDLRVHMTCHRYEAHRDLRGDLVAVRTSKQAGHYKQYSTVLDE